VRGRPSYLKLPVLAKRPAELAARQQRDGETRISAREYRYTSILQDFDSSFHLKVFSGALPHPKYFSKLRKPKVMASVTIKEFGEFQNFF
jgi:hypothetical protein